MKIPGGTKREVRDRHNFFGKNCCEDCGITEQLIFHHLETFELESGEVVELAGRERPEHLALVCQDCHTARHTDLNGDYHDTEEEAQWAANKIG